VLEGNGWFNGLPVKSGQGFLMWQNRVNSMSADMRHPWKFIYVSFSGSLAEQILVRSGFTTDDTIFDVSNLEYIKSICENMVYEYHPEHIADLKMTSVLFDLLSLNQNNSGEKEGKQNSHSSDMNAHVLNAVRFISKKYRSSIGVAEVAGAAHISEKYLRELFKKETGKSVQAYLTDTRLSAAVTLLSNSKYNIGEVASLSGFGEYRNFARVFKERYGITPSEYREASIKKE
jgi:AraC-like DNA-binding protein